jgi:hypothetical protein
LTGGFEIEIDETRVGRVTASKPQYIHKSCPLIHRTINSGTILRSRFALLLLCFLCFLLSSFDYVLGFPNGAGGCDGAVPAVGGPHTDPNKTIVDSDLFSGGVTVTLGGRELDVGQTLDFPVNEELELSVNASFFAYRGILIRMQVPTSYNEDPSTILQPASTDLQMADVCEVPAVGVTHIDNTDKFISLTTVNFPIATTRVIFDITVVLFNRVNASAFVYSRYSANFRNTSDIVAPTSSPSSTGTLIVVTEFPTIAPYRDGNPRPIRPRKPTIWQTKTPTKSRPTFEYPSTSPHDIGSDGPSIVPSPARKSQLNFLHSG